MVLQITQETFNDAVKENIEDLGLSKEEAVEEAVKQFESQGVDLSQIIKEYMAEVVKSELIDQSIKDLQKYLKSKEAPERVCATLETLKTECDKGMQYKVVAGKAGAYNLLLDINSTYHKEKIVQMACFKALVSLMTKQPDLLDDRGVNLIVSNFKDNEVPFEVKRLTLRWAKECCVLHERNRQKIFDSHITDDVKEILNDGSNLELVRDALSLCRALVLDDDVRVEIGKAHEHARIIASETLCSLLALLTRYKQEEQLTVDIITTMTCLLVRSEFCKKVEDANGLEVIKHVMETFNGNEKIVKQSFKLLKALAGNDSCKSCIIQKMNFAKVIHKALVVNAPNPGIVSAGLTCVAALTLRSPENSKIFFDVGIPQAIVDAMKEFPDNKQLQKSACWAVRNMVSRSKNQVQKFLELGIESVLQDDLKKFKDIEYDIKAALRDLGCKVQLKEEWTGKGGALHSDTIKRT